MYVLGIESTCDETAASVVCNGKILSNVIATQIDLQSVYGGVVPELACRRHSEVILPVVKEALEKAGITKEQVNLVAAARGPGLIGAIMIGLNFAQALAAGLNRPFVGVNHIEAHLHAVLMSHDTIPLPALGMIVSGGHTSLVIMHKPGEYEPISTTVDDAAGEAFDKVAKIMGLPYPGGPIIEKLARSGDSERYPFRAGTVKGRPHHFSFSGLKTAVLYACKGKGSSPRDPLLIQEADKPHIAASFQRAVLTDLVTKATQVANSHKCASIIVGGGVSHNQALRHALQEAASQPVFWPGPGLSLDNAAMIAGLAEAQFHRKGADPLSLAALTRIPF